MKKIDVKEGVGAPRGKDEYDLVMERYLSGKPRKLNWVDGRPPKRDELHDRTGLRRTCTPQK